jgi:LysM repeat protein
MNTEKQYLVKTPMSGKVYRPLIEVSFHSQNTVYTAKSGTVNKYGEKLNPNDVILSVTTQKQLDTPAGAWSMTLAGVQWAGRIRPQDIAVIKMGYAGEAKLTTVMVGLVDKANRKMSMGGDGKPQLNSTITGRDFGKLFVKDVLKFYPEIAGKNASDFFLTDVGWINLMKIFTTDSTMKGTPARIIWNIMQYIFPKIQDVSWKVWNETLPTPAAKTVLAKDLIHCMLGKIDFFMPFVFTADQYEGAIWNLVQRAAPATFTELFIDCRDPYEFWHASEAGRLVPHDIELNTVETKSTNYFRFGQDGVKITLCLRQTPFESAHKKNLKRHTITQMDVISEDMSISDEQHYNLFWAGTSINPLGIDLKRVAPPLMNEANAKKYGLNPLEVNVEGMEISAQTVLEGMSKEYTKKLKAWFENNHTYWSGTLEIRGKADIRIGQMVNYQSQTFNNEYYVEGVQHTHNLYQDWTTTLTLTRGMPVNTLVTANPPAATPPKKPPTSTTPKPTSTTYKVVKGDTLWAIAHRKYGDPRKWTKIWEANKTMLIKRDRRNATDHGHWIFPAQLLIIPS